MVGIFSFNVLLLIARLAFVGLVYLALFSVLYVVRRDLAWQTRRGLEAANRPAAGMAPGRLQVINPGSDRALKAGQSLPLALENTLGADPSSDLVLRDAFMSKQHAQLWWDGSAWWIHDLGSKNGVRINGSTRALPGRPQRLMSGSRIQLGDMELELRDD